MSDICSNKHGGNGESIAAFGGGKAEQRQRVLDAIKASEAGLTCDELAAQWGVHCNAISGRFTELKREGHIEKQLTRPTRTGKSARVYTATLGVA